eukprot:s1501_g15.t1
MVDNIFDGRLWRKLWLKQSKFRIFSNQVFLCFPMAGVTTEPVPITDAAPVTSAVQMGTGMPISTTYPMEPMGAVAYTDAGYAMAGAPMVYSSSPYMMPGAESIGAMPYPMTYTTEMPYPAYSNLDHSQGKWFAPGEMLPAGYIVTAHPEGHTAPQEGHLMSDKARESFVITTGTKASAPKARKSNKNKKSGCCN